MSLKIQLISQILKALTWQPLGVQSKPCFGSERISMVILCSRQCFIAIERLHDHGNSYQKNMQLELVYMFRGLVHYRHGWKHGGTQADIVAER